MGATWERETRICATIALRPDLLSAIRAHLELHEITEAEAQALVCFETASRRLKKPSRLERKMGVGHMAMAQAVMVTPTRLIWATGAQGDEPFAKSELLANLEVTDYEKGPGFDIIPDHGIDIQGIRAMGGTVGSLFFGLGEGPDADRARHILKSAVKAAHGEGPPVEA
jgi:hypothetical protein